ncbi:allophanate hydrolase, partial [Paraburkholderia sp. SIMBA_030]
LAGGVDVEPVMGSRSTDLKGAFGGFEGRGLKRGDALKVRGNVSRGVRESGLGAVPQGLASFWDELVSGVVSIRVVP